VRHRDTTRHADLHAAGSLMKWASAVSQRESLEEALDEAVEEVRRATAGEPIDLVFAFVSSDELGDGGEFVQTLGERFPNAVVLGCTARSIIGSGVEVEEGPGLSLTAAILPDVEISPFHISQDEMLAAGREPEAWRQLVGAGQGEASALVLLGDPFGGDSEQLIAGLEAAYPGTAQIGGLASGADEPGRNLLFINGRSVHEGFTGVALGGDIVLDTVVAQGCRPVGQPMFVTRCERNVVLELDGRPPLEIVNELFADADEREQALFQSALFVGVQMDAERAELGQGDFLVRNLLGGDTETGAIAVGALLEEKQVVQFQLRDGETASDDVVERLSAYARDHTGACGALLFSCLGRGQGMYGRPNHDSDAFTHRLGNVSLSGFFCNGEIGPVNGRTFLHGYTSAFGIFRPRGWRH